MIENIYMATLEEWYKAVMFAMKKNKRGVITNEEKRFFLNEEKESKSEKVREVSEKKENE